MISLANTSAASAAWKLYPANAVGTVDLRCGAHKDFLQTPASYTQSTCTISHRVSAAATHCFTGAGAALLLTATACGAPQACARL